MTYQPITPFRRAIRAADVERLTSPAGKVPPEGVNKWEALRELGVAREAYGLSDRTLAVLQALLSFHPETVLRAGQGDLTVYPANKTICDRLNGMPSSTMRRHLAALVSAGILTRRDSPNGKRYVRRFNGEKVAFGFDLTPLAAQFPAICAAAEDKRAADAALKHLRETVSLMRRDLAGLAAYGAEIQPDAGRWDALSDRAALVGRDLRRKLGMDDLEALRVQLADLLEDAQNLLEDADSPKMSTSTAQNEQHHQSSNKDRYDSESPQLVNHEDERGRDVLTDRRRKPDLPRVTLRQVLAACTEIVTYTDDPLRDWHQLVRLCDRIRPMLGITGSAWHDAKAVMGAEEASVVLAAMVQRIGELKSPGGYLRALTKQAEENRFSSGPMIMALLRREAA